MSDTGLDDTSNAISLPNRAATEFMNRKNLPPSKCDRISGLRDPHR